MNPVDTTQSFLFNFHFNIALLPSHRSSK
jgi:hypothetical protein